jgi:hypothetical protein
MYYIWVSYLLTYTMLTAAQFSTFSLDARLQMIYEMGSCIYAETTGASMVKLYSLFNFAVEVHIKKDDSKAYKAEPLFSCRHLFVR